MKNVSELGLTTWSELCKSLQKAGFEPQHIHQIINSKDNKLAEAMFEFFEMRGGETILRFQHQDRAGRVYSFDWKDGLSCVEIARIISLSNDDLSLEELTQILIKKHMTYSRSEIDKIMEMSDSTKGADSPDWEKTMVSLWSNNVSCMFFVHNEEKTKVSVIYPGNVFGTTKEDFAEIKEYPFGYILESDQEEGMCGWNYGDDDYSSVGLFINVE